MIIIDLIRSDGTGQRLQAKHRSLLVHAFDQVSENKEFSRVILIDVKKHGHNNYVLGVECIKEWLKTGDSSLLYGRYKKKARKKQRQKPTKSRKRRRQQNRRVKVDRRKLVATNKIGVYHGEMVLDNFAKRLKAVRLDRGYTQQKLEEISGINHKQYTTYESGRYVPNLQTMIKLCNALQIDMNYLFSKEE